MTSPLPPDVETRLATERNVWLCTVRRDGSPHVTPVWFVHADGTWWIGCDAFPSDGGSSRARLSDRSPRAGDLRRRQIAVPGGDFRNDAASAR
ncbi:pyridoxamine 5'-phosphate oxidase family protein [Micromonospora chersina]